MTTATLVLALCLAVFYLLLGGGKLAATSPMRERAAHVGVSVSTYRGIGVLEVAGAGGLLIGGLVPALGAAAGVGLLLLMVGAVVTHVRNGDGRREMTPAVVVGLLIVAYLVVLFGSIR
ncbi:MULTISPECIES: DoxX family protein [unclassified Rhodococcus (in: high G+C Gram-positive bacteria)]|uniref:DoxX family protein n=1 Tax=unclassified Rhodococcus (in: high G+C Gram-positive bacteria) TaxID=192944 RepID=UPI00163A0A13|nr:MULTISPECIES: DoxX family protein [unclassified Rhodococcus (in: high G+C Gram-positive bacteria)]MBC2642631.1 DoxX family protein [Rhodococcus sp. 3A]MBC2892627.1 DoxX family protein [Rhodococcus sp. 4CII]